MEEQLRLLITRLEERAKMSLELIAEHDDKTAQAHHAAQAAAYKRAATMAAELLPK